MLKLEGETRMVKVRMSEMNRADIQKALDRGFGTVVFAVGSNEQHGPHLPTCTDSLIGDVIANKVAVKLGKTLQAFKPAYGALADKLTHKVMSRDCVLIARY